MIYYKTICLDYDGTIHNSLEIYYKAFLKAYNYLVDNNYQPSKEWTRNEVKAFLGQNPKEMWESFKPRIPDNIISYVSNLIGKSMTDSLINHEAVLYDDAINTLKYLKSKGYYLVYLSNSKEYYMELNKSEFNLSSYFDLFIVSETYNYIPKKEILKQIMPKLEKPILMVGDRIHDMESGYYNNLDTVACLYGFGNEEELKDATYKINDIKELKEIL